MIKADFKAVAIWQNNGASFIVQYSAAHPSFRDLYAEDMVGPCTIGALDIPNLVFPTVEDARQYTFDLHGANMITILNNALGANTFELGEMIEIDQVTDDALKALQAGGVTSAMTLTPVNPGTTTGGDTGTQIDADKRSSVHLTYSTQITYSLTGSPESVVTLKKCATNDADESNWTVCGSTAIKQPTGLTLTIGQVVSAEGQISADIPAGWYVKAVKTGAGTHSEAQVSGEKTVYN